MLLCYLLFSTLGFSQDIYPGYGNYSFSQSLIEYEDHYYLSFTDQTEIDSVYSHRFYKLDQSLNRIDSLVYDVSNLINGNGLLTGRLLIVNGGLEFVGLGTSKHRAGTVSMPEDSTYFVRLKFDGNLGVITSEKLFIKTGASYTSDVIIDGDKYIFNASVGFFYWVGVVDITLNSSITSEPRETAGVGVDNPYFLTKVIRNLESDAILLKTTVAHIDVYNSNLDFDSIYQIPFVDWGVPAFGWMSQGYAQKSNGYFVASCNGYNSYVMELNSQHEYVNEFIHLHTDSLVTNSLYRCLAMDNEENLLIGMHIRAETDPHFNLLKVIKCDTNGNLIWQSTLGEAGQAEYVQRDIIATEDNAVLIMADRHSSPELDYSDGIVLYKLDTNGQVLSISDFKSKDKRFKLHPNPCSNVLNITTDIAYDHISVLNAQGQTILDLAQHRTLDISMLSKGLYIINFVSNNEILNSQKLLVK